MPRVFQLPYSGLEERDVVVVVEGDTRAENIDEGKSLVLDPILDELREVLYV